MKPLQDDSLPKRPDHPDECMCPSCVSYWTWHEHLSEAELEAHGMDCYGSLP